MQDVVQRTENFVLWPLIYGQWNNLVTTSVYLHFISLLYMCLPNYWLKDIADKQMFYFRSILKSRKQMTRYSDPADICRYNLLKNHLNCPKWIAYVRPSFWFIHDTPVGFFSPIWDLRLGHFQLGKIAQQNRNIGKIHFYLYDCNEIYDFCHLFKY